MCFVALYKQGDTRWLLSNRDEYLLRPKALVPHVEKNYSFSLMMPKDAKAGGTWVAVRDDGIAAILLNGADQPHESRPPYRHSRGLIIPQILSKFNPEWEMENTSFAAIEPFTLVLSTPEKLLSFKWNGEVLNKELENQELSPCWSSSTLYSPSQALERKKYWKDWVGNQDQPDKKAFLHFASSPIPGEMESWIKMKRKGGLQTISSSLIKIMPHSAEMNYVAYPDPIIHFNTIPIVTKKNEAIFEET